jgi:hypothetical protein
MCVHIFGIFKPPFSNSYMFQIFVTDNGSILEDSMPIYYGVLGATGNDSLSVGRALSLLGLKKPCGVSPVPLIPQFLNH